MRILLFLLAMIFSPISFGFAADGVDFDIETGRYVPSEEAGFAGLAVTMERGWHIYWKSPGEGGLPPEISVRSASNLARFDIEWPMPKEFETSGAVSFGYDGSVVLPFRLTPVVSGRPILVDMTVTLYGCSNICVPFTKDVSLVLETDESAAANAKTTHWLKGVVSNAPATITGSFRSPSEIVFEIGMTERDRSRPPVLDLGNTGVARLTSDQGNILVFSVSEDAGSLKGIAYEGSLLVPMKNSAPLSLAVVFKDRDTLSWSILAIAFSGGLILNLMPCVLPVLALKLSGIGKAVDARRQSFLWSAAGIVSSFLLLAILAITARSLGGLVGWGVQFQSPIFLSGMAIIVFLFAVSMLDGLFIHLPYRLQDRLSRLGAGDGRVSSFAQGLVATLLATPCSAPLVGTAVGFAFASSPAVMIAVFLAMGLGMAAPYLVIGVLPGSERLLPRSGPWMARMKTALAFGMLGTSGVLLGFFWISNPIFAAFIAAIFIAILLRLVGINITSAAGIVVLAASTYLVIPDLAEPKASFWKEFSPGVISEAVGSGKVVVVDISAAWCITCKVNDTVAFSSEDVVSRLSSNDVLPMRGDWTRPNEEISNYLKSFNRYGIPFTVVYSKAYPDGLVLPEILSPSTLMNAL